MTKLLNHINTYQSEADYQNDKTKNFPNVSYIVENDNVLFVKEKTDYSNDYLTFEAIEDGKFTFTGTSSNSLSYSLDDGQTWTALASGSASPTVTAGNKIMWKGTCTPNNNGIGNFSSTGTFNVQGNIMSLLFGDDFTNKTNLTGKDYAFYRLFYQNASIKSAKNIILPATTLASYCYGNMFEGCTSLVNTPTLPATTLASNCYFNMFNGCTGLTSAPVLPATTLADACYRNMFSGCTNLVNAPELPATELASSCYYFMFNGCTNLTTAPVLPARTLTEYCYLGMFYGCTGLVNAPELPVTTLANYCYYNMFSGCTSLTTAPVLPARTFTTYCYANMFEGCTKLNYIKAMFTATPGTNYTYNWVGGVASSGTFVKNSEATWNVTGDNGIPEGWTIQRASS